MDVTVTKTIPPWLSPQHSWQGSCGLDFNPHNPSHTRRKLCVNSHIIPIPTKPENPVTFRLMYMFFCFSHHVTPHTYAYTVSVCVAFPYSTVISDADSRPPLVARFIGFRGEHWSLAAGAFSSGGGGELGRPRSISSGSTDARSNMNLRSS